MKSRKVNRGRSMRAAAKRRILRLSLSVALATPVIVGAGLEGVSASDRLIPPLPVSVPSFARQAAPESNTGARLPRQNPFCLPAPQAAASPIALASGGQAVSGVFDKALPGLQLRRLDGTASAATRFLPPPAPGDRTTTSSTRHRLTVSEPAPAPVQDNPMVRSLHHENSDLVEVGIDAAMKPGAKRPRTGLARTVPTEQKSRFVIVPRVSAPPSRPPAKSASPVEQVPAARNASPGAEPPRAEVESNLGYGSPAPSTRAEPVFRRPQLPTAAGRTAHLGRLNAATTSPTGLPGGFLPEGDSRQGRVAAAAAPRAEQSPPSVQQTAAAEPIRLTLSDRPADHADSAAAGSGGDVVSLAPVLPRDNSLADPVVKEVAVDGVKNARMPRLIKPASRIRLLDSEGWAIPESDTAELAEATHDEAKTTCESLKDGVPEAVEDRQSRPQTSSPVVGLAEPAVLGDEHSHGGLHAGLSDAGGAEMAPSLPEPAIDKSVLDASSDGLPVSTSILAPNGDASASAAGPESVQRPKRRVKDRFNPPVSVASAPIGTAAWDSSRGGKPVIHRLQGAAISGAIPARVVSVVKRVRFDDRVKQIASEFGIDPPSGEATPLYMARAQVKSLTIGGTLHRVNVDNGKVCNALSVSNNEIKLIGAGNGVTRLAVWATMDGQETVQARVFEVHVTDAGESAGQSDRTHLEVLDRTIRHAFPQAEVEIRPVGDELVVEGFCMGTESARQIVRMIRKTCLMPVRDELMVR